MISNSRCTPRGTTLTAVVVAAAIGLAACAQNSTVVVTYGPLLNAPALCTTGSPTSTACNQVKKPITQLAQVACIYSISNTGKKAKDFTFAMSNLNVQSVPQPFYSGDEPGGLKKMPATVLVKAGTKVQNLGVIVLSADVSGETVDEMGGQVPKFSYTTSPIDSVGVIFQQFPPNAGPLWDPNTVFANVTVPACQQAK
jgi:hypothetical protein